MSLVAFICLHYSSIVIQFRVLDGRGPVPPPLERALPGVDLARRSLDWSPKYAFHIIPYGEGYSTVQGRDGVYAGGLRPMLSVLLY